LNVHVSMETHNYTSNTGYLHFKIFIINYCFHYELLDRQLQWSSVSEDNGKLDETKFPLTKFHKVFLKGDGVTNSSLLEATSEGHDLAGKWAAEEAS